MKEEIEKIEPIIKGKNYPFFCLLDEDGKIIIPAKRPDKKHPELYLKHWNFIKHKLHNELPAGKYILCCFYDAARKTKFDYIITKTQEDVNATPVELKIETPINNAEVMNDAMSIEEYKKLITEIEKLKSEKALLMTELALANQEIEDLYAQLEEAPLEDDGGGLLGGLKAVVTPEVLGLLDKFMSQRDKSIDLEEKRLQMMAQRPKQSYRQALQNTQRPQPRQQPIYEQPAQQEFVQQESFQDNNQEQSEEQYLQEQIAYYDNLLDNDEDQANRELDQLEIDNPELYQIVCQSLELDEDQQQ